MKKIVLAAALLTYSLFAKEVNTVNEELLLNNKELISSLVGKVKDKEIIELFKNVAAKDKSKKQEIEEKYSLFEGALDGFTNTDSIKELTGKMYSKKLEDLSDKNAFTLIYFVSEDTEYSSINKFTKEVDVLKSYYPKIEAKLFFNSYPKNFVDEIEGEIKAIFEKEIDKKTEYGNIVMKLNGSYKYTVRKDLRSISGKKMTDTITLSDVQNISHSIAINLRANKDGVVKIEEDFNPKGMYRYLMELKDYGINSTHIKINVHPWAFQDLGLKQVPAYLLSYCNNDDFRFKECDNKYIIKGNISLEYFFNEIAKTNEYFKEHHHSLEKGLKDD